MNPLSFFGYYFSLFPVFLWIVSSISRPRSTQPMFVWVNRCAAAQPSSTPTKRLLHLLFLSPHMASCWAALYCSSPPPSWLEVIPTSAKPNLKTSNSTLPYPKILFREFTEFWQSSDVLVFSDSQYRQSKSIPGNFPSRALIAARFSTL